MDRAATPAIDQSGLILNLAPRKVPVFKPVPSKVKAATNHFCQRAVTSLEKSALIIPPEPLVSPLSDSPLAIRTIVPDKARWDAQSYQQHSSSQANDSAGLVNYLLGNAIVRYPLSRVCDVGCGTGQNMKSYQQAFHAEIYGADPSPAMCTQAQTTVAAEQMPIQCRGAEDFSFGTSFPLILSTHALHWIAKPAMPKALSNIHAQLTNDGIFAAVFAASKTGLPFDDALQAIKSRERYQAAFCSFTLNQFFYSAEEITTLLQHAQFQIHTLTINPVHKTFADGTQLLRFVQQWLSEYKHLQQNYPSLANDFLSDVIDNYLTRTGQQSVSPVTWEERTFTLVAAKKHRA